MKLLFGAGLGGDIGIALGLIRRSQPHYHSKITEWYFVLDGNIDVHPNGKVKKLKRWDILKIEPRTVHWLLAMQKF